MKRGDSARTLKGKGRLDVGTQIRWIAFDAVGTLITPEPAVGIAYQRVARKHGSRLTTQDILSRFRLALDNAEKKDLAGSFDWTLPDRLRTSEQHERQRWQSIVAAVICDVEETTACFVELFDHFARPSSWKCFSDVADALPALQSAGYRLAVASNFDSRLHAICDGLPDLEPIERRAVSSEIGYRKPSLHFFRSLVDVTGVSGEEILFVGDDWKNDVLGARQAGLHAVFLQRNGSKKNSGTVESLGELPGFLSPSGNDRL